jgi:hypothetical protein
LRLPWKDVLDRTMLMGNLRRYGAGGSLVGDGAETTASNAKRRGFTAPHMADHTR